MKDPVDRAVRAISRRNSYVFVWAQFGVAHLVVEQGRFESEERPSVPLKGKRAEVRLWALRTRVSEELYVA